MPWTHTYNVEYDEPCEECGGELELRMIGKEKWVYYCPTCLKHKIDEAKTPSDEERK